MIVPGIQSDILGLGLLLIVGFLQWRAMSSARARQAPEEEEDRRTAA